jgi:cell division protein FtsQ
MHQLTGKKKKITLYLIFLFLLSTISGKFIDNHSYYSTKISKIKVEGLSNYNNSKILNELKKILHKNILIIEKKKIQKIIDKYNIVEEYNIKKVYPSTISVNLKPTKFIARISNDSQLLVGNNGKLIEDKKNKETLPYIFGEFNSKEFLVFKKNVEQSKFTFAKFKTLYYFQSNRWDILTNDDVLIKLPQHNFLRSLNLAHKIISSDEFKNKNFIDLRMNNHLIIK